MYRSAFSSVSWAHERGSGMHIRAHTHTHAHTTHTHTQHTCVTSHYKLQVHCASRLRCMLCTHACMLGGACTTFLSMFIILYCIILFQISCFSIAQFLCVSSLPVLVCLTWPHHRLTALLYLYMSACKSQVFTDEDNRSLSKRVICWFFSVLASVSVNRARSLFLYLSIPWKSSYCLSWNAHLFLHTYTQWCLIIPLKTSCCIYISLAVYYTSTYMYEIIK